MSDELDQPRRFQFSIAAALLVTAAIGLGTALLLAGRMELALWGVFPFAVGLIVGQFNTHPLWSPFVAAAVVASAVGLNRRGP